MFPGHGCRPGRSHAGRGPAAGKRLPELLLRLVREVVREVCEFRVLRLPGAVAAHPHPHPLQAALVVPTDVRPHVVRRLADGLRDCRLQHDTPQPISHMGHVVTEQVQLASHSDHHVCVGICHERDKILSLDPAQYLQEGPAGHPLHQPRELLHVAPPQQRQDPVPDEPPVLRELPHEQHPAAPRREVRVAERIDESRELPRRDAAAQEQEQDVGLVEPVYQAAELVRGRQVLQEGDHRLLQELGRQQHDGDEEPVVVRLDRPQQADQLLRRGPQEDQDVLRGDAVDDLTHALRVHVSRDCAQRRGLPAAAIDHWHEHVHEAAPPDILQEPVEHPREHVRGQRVAELPHRAGLRANHEVAELDGVPERAEGQEVGVPAD
mmetsp:Transcript_82281/g.233305  ORF Transcript_82281/g.233305 Transcript_82281/m.233305 type:complete len:379 (-) Transcript_82281:128-1264(-)